MNLGAHMHWFVRIRKLTHTVHAMLQCPRVAVRPTLAFNERYYIAAPKTSIDLTMQHGDEIEIEQRPKDGQCALACVRD